MNPRDINLINKTPEPNFWSLPNWYKIFSVALVPVAIAYSGSIIQSAIAEKNLEKDYVAISVSILTSPNKKIDEDLRGWAVEILNMHAPISLPAKSQELLKSGDGLLGKASLKVSNGDLFVLDSAFDGRAIIEITHSKGCFAEYKSYYKSVTDKGTFSSNKLFEDYVKDADGNSINKGNTIIKAGPFSVEWSCNSESSGWIYPKQYSTEIILDRKLDEYIPAQ
ncbi:hypothetical protein [Colwellia sp. Bg11-12]|jgi:hypothetical protein|uniref:hypothetical protein n=1 Tax=Colwellia sp. Bg11-12 TaxID=2759817 RepID=UPI0015F499A6|nr:hypothetical protein [Colwellia sp. Bg11-12]MBA6263919.1 hypothetical protein [Colwellia sp. Bg11-12]